jgi:hypothetical protein
VPVDLKFDKKDFIRKDQSPQNLEACFQRLLTAIEESKFDVY